MGQLAWKILLATVLIAGLAVRAFVAPFTTGSDIAQFAGFADTFLKRGECFFHYAGRESSSLEKWPYPWPYPYGVLPILLLGAIRLIAPQPVKSYWKGSTYYVYAPPEWIIAVKAMLVFFDLVTALLIYRLVSKYSIKRGVAAATFYFLNPAVIYTSSIYGMLDPIPSALLLVAIVLYESGGSDRVRVYLSALLAGLAVTSKPNALYPGVFFLLYVLLKNRGEPIHSLGAVLLGFACGTIAPFAVFEAMCPGSIQTFVNVLTDVSTPRYNPPIVYSFNGFTSLATYLHDKTGGDYMWMITYWVIPGSLLLALLAFWTICKIEVDRLYEILYLSYLIYVTTYWRINYQYFLVLVALSSIYVFAMAGRPTLKLLVVLHLALVSSWTVMFPVSWWARVHIENPNIELVKVLDRISLMVFSQEVYLFYEIVLTMSGYVVLACHFSSMNFTRCTSGGLRGLRHRVRRLIPLSTFRRSPRGTQPIYPPRGNSNPVLWDSTA